MNLRAPLDIDGLAPDYSNSTVNALESLQSCAKLARTKLSTSWCMGSVWSYYQGGQLLWSIESQMRGQGNHSNHSVPRATIRAQHHSNHIYRETAVLTQNWFYGEFCETGCSQLDVALHVYGFHVFTGTLYSKSFSNIIQTFHWVSPTSSAQYDGTLLKWRN